MANTTESYTEEGELEYGEPGRSHRNGTDDAIVGRFRLGLHDVEDQNIDGEEAGSPRDLSGFPVSDSDMLSVVSGRGILLRPRKAPYQLDPELMRRLTAGAFTVEEEINSAVDHDYQESSLHRYIIVPPLKLQDSRIQLSPGTTRRRSTASWSEEQERHAKLSLYALHSSVSASLPPSEINQFSGTVYRPGARPILLHSFNGCLMLQDIGFKNFMGVALRCLLIDPINEPDYHFFVDVLAGDGMLWVLEVDFYIAGKTYKEVQTHFSNPCVYFRLRRDDELDLVSFHPEPLQHYVILHDDQVGTVYWKPDPNFWLVCPDVTGSTSPTMSSRSLDETYCAERSIDFVVNAIRFLYPGQSKLFEVNGDDIETHIVNTDDAEKCLGPELQKIIAEQMPRKRPFMIKIRQYRTQKPRSSGEIRYTDIFEVIPEQDYPSDESDISEEAEEVDQKGTERVVRIPGLAIGFPYLDRGTTEMEQQVEETSPDEERLDLGHFIRELRPIRIVRLARTSGVWCTRKIPITTILDLLGMKLGDSFKFRIYLGDSNYQKNRYEIVNDWRTRPYGPIDFQHFRRTHPTDGVLVIKGQENPGPIRVTAHYDTIRIGDGTQEKPHLRIWHNAPDKDNFMKIIADFFYLDQSNHNMDLDIHCAPEFQERLFYNTGESEGVLRRQVWDRITGSGTIYVKPVNWSGAIPKVYGDGGQESDENEIDDQESNSSADDDSEDDGCIKLDNSNSSDSSDSSDDSDSSQESDVQAGRRTEDGMYTRDVASLSSSDKETDEAIEDEWNCEDKDSSIGSELYTDEEPSPINSRREAGKFRSTITFSNKEKRGVDMAPSAIIADDDLDPSEERKRQRYLADSGEGEECRICQKLFPRQDIDEHYSQHREDHQRVIQDNSLCPLCMTSRWSIMSLKRRRKHILSHRRSPSVELVCPVPNCARNLGNFREFGERRDVVTHMQAHLSRPVESHGIRGDLAAEFDQMPTIQKGSKDGTDKTRRKRQSPSPDSPPSRRPGDGSPSDDGKATGRRKLRPRIRPPRKESDANFVPDDAQADDDEGIISDGDDDIDDLLRPSKTPTGSQPPKRPTGKGKSDPGKVDRRSAPPTGKKPPPTKKPRAPDEPTVKPKKPTKEPTTRPKRPTRATTREPTEEPAKKPNRPARAPTREPTEEPPTKSKRPARAPTREPTEEPPTKRKRTIKAPTREPTEEPTKKPEKAPKKPPKKGAGKAPAGGDRAEGKPAEPKAPKEAKSKHCPVCWKNIQRLSKDRKDAHVAACGVTLEDLVTVTSTEGKAKQKVAEEAKQLADEKLQAELLGLAGSRSGPRPGPGPGPGPAPGPAPVPASTGAQQGRGWGWGMKKERSRDGDAEGGDGNADKDSDEPKAKRTRNFPTEKPAPTSGKTKK